MKKLLLSIGLLMVAQGSSGLLARKEMSKETLLKGALDVSTVRLIQAAKNASDDDLQEELWLSKDVIDIAKSLTPEEIVVLEKNREAIMKKDEEEFKKRLEEIKKWAKSAEESPKAYVMRVFSYPQIMAMRDPKNATDDLLIEAVSLSAYSDKKEAAKRLQAARDLTQQEVDGLKKLHEEKMAKRVIVHLNSLGLPQLLPTKEMTKEALLKGDSPLTARSVRVIQAAKKASDDDLKERFRLSGFEIDVAKSLTPEEIVFLEKNREAIIKEKEEESKKTKESYEKESKEAERSPKVFVTTRLSYPEIKIMRGEANDKILIDAFDFGDKQSAARLQAVRDLTPEEVDGLKKKYEQREAERAK